MTDPCSDPCSCQWRTIAAVVPDMPARLFPGGQAKAHNFIEGELEGACGYTGRAFLLSAKADYVFH